MLAGPATAGTPISPWIKCSPHCSPDLLALLLTSFTVTRWCELLRIRPACGALRFLNLCLSLAK